MNRAIQRTRLAETLELAAVALLFGPSLLGAQPIDYNNPGVMEPVTSALQGRDVRIPNTDQSIDGNAQSNVHGGIVWEDALDSLSILGYPIVDVASPNDDMRAALQRMVETSQANDEDGLEAAAADLEDILLGTTQGRIYDGFSMLNFNRWKHPDVGPQHFPADAIPGEYKMKWARDTGDTFTSPFDGEQRRVWEVEVAMLYYDGQIDSDTFLLRFPVDAHPDDTVRVNYSIYSLVREDFSPTMVMLDRREAQNTVQFPYKGMDSVWIAFDPGQVLHVTVKYPPIRMLRGVYTWGWRVHPPRIQFLQPIYDQVNAHTQEVELDPQGASFAYRNREDLTLESIGDAAPEMKMYQVAMAALDGTPPLTILKWLTQEGQGPRGTWIDWSDLAKEQRQLPPEAWDALAQEGLGVGDLGQFNMVSAFLNNEMYGEGPFESEVDGWRQRDVFTVKLINLDHHTHYFRNVDFGTRLNDDILRCCGGGETSFEVMNFKPSYGAPKVAEMQWRAGWGFRPHYDIIQQSEVFARSSDRVKLQPYTGGFGDTFFGYQYSEQARSGDFRFNPPPFIITDAAHPSPDVLRDADGLPGLVIGQHTEGYGVAQLCPDAAPGFCPEDIQAYNPDGVLNWPPPPLQGVGGNPDHPVELRFPPFLRNPDQAGANAGDIIPPTGAWRPFLWINPNNGTLFVDPNDPSKGYWSDFTYSHGAPVFARSSRTSTIELPRSSGQVFYQFDDLFHDNSIFSPHPLFEGVEELDEISTLNAFYRGFYRIRGRLDPLPNGLRAEWVTLHLGAADQQGCHGPAVARSRVLEDGFFVFRCGAEACSSPLAEKASSGDSVCVRSVAGGFADLTLPPM